MTCVPGVVLILPKKTSGAVVVEEEAKVSRFMWGEVIAVGPDYLSDFGVVMKADNYAKVGEEVAFYINDPTYDFLKIDNEKYYTIHFKDILLRRDHA